MPAWRVTIKAGVNRPILTVPVQKVDGDSSAPVQDLLAVEEPLEIRLGDKSISITMRTPGHDFELAAGFLFTEGILHDAAEIREIRWSHIENGNPRQLGNSVTVELNPGVEVDLDRLERHFYTTSSCGVCGKASIEAIQMQGCPVLPRNAPVVAASVIHDLPGTLRRAQPVFERTGGLHAAALFDPAGNLQLLREDVGRHNAVDAIAGMMWLDRVEGGDKIFYTTGRLTSEMVIKAAQMEIPFLVSRSGLTQMGYEIARQVGMTMIGRATGRHYLLFTGGERFRADA